MSDGTPPSVTARRVAAHRLGFERLAAPYGDPAADEALARDVAGDTGAGSSEWMARYLRGRTAFFDRVVVNAIDRGVTEVVSVGAGYDGRALRYAKPGVRWWEVDRAATQADKRARLAHLAIAVDDISFVTHDLTQSGLARALIAAGYQPDGIGLFICEGVVVYLPAAAVELLFREVRSLATVGTRLAFSVGTSTFSDDRAAHRQRFESGV
ncbi:MAG TPA: SAM-dependent methyltransferase, partial [Acidimicrobiales bacterium]|nr:SAM-dependent methyltransferase [Acidimicrobiales bacterium]